MVINLQRMAGKQANIGRKKLDKQNAIQLYSGDQEKISPPSTLMV